VRAGVAENPNTPIKLLEKLAEDKSPYVRRLVAGNPSTPIKLLEELAMDEDEDVRRGVAGNLCIIICYHGKGG
jgi:HEAT repeat protein